MNWAVGQKGNFYVTRYWAALGPAAAGGGASRAETQLLPSWFIFIHRHLPLPSSKPFPWAEAGRRQHLASLCRDPWGRRHSLAGSSSPSCPPQALCPEVHRFPWTSHCSWSPCAQRWRGRTFPDLVKVTGVHRSRDHAGLAVTWSHDTRYIIHELQNDTPMHKAVQLTVRRPHQGNNLDWL